MKTMVVGAVFNEKEGILHEVFKLQNYKSKN